MCAWSSVTRQCVMLNWCCVGLGWVGLCCVGLCCVVLYCIVLGCVVLGCVVLGLLYCVGLFRRYVWFRGHKCDMCVPRLHLQREIIFCFHAVLCSALKAQWKRFGIQQFYVLPTQCICVFCVDNINWLVCISETVCVYCAVRTESSTILVDLNLLSFNKGTSVYKSNILYYFLVTLRHGAVASLLTCIARNSTHKSDILTSNLSRFSSLALCTRLYTAFNYGTTAPFSHPFRFIIHKSTVIPSTLLWAMLVTWQQSRCGWWTLLQQHSTALLVAAEYTWLCVSWTDTVKYKE
jgi:hypothetical protein